MNPKLEKKLISTAKKVLQDEAEAILSLNNAINDDFIDCIDIILENNSRIVVTGIGKSAIIAQKIVATMNSTGQPAVFMHAADAIHGDLGIISPDDVVICISKSGDTPEIKVLVPLLKRMCFKLVALVSNTESYLAKQSDYVFAATIVREACPLNLAPTTSTTAALALGDAFAMALLEARNFGSEDFAKYHPGGSLGKRLYLKVKDIYPNHAIPKVALDANIQTVILEMTSKRLGATAVVDENDDLAGMITDGDLRRMLNKFTSYEHLKASDIMTASPITINPDEYASFALKLMEDRSITQLLVEDNKKVLGFVHLHDLLKEGIV